MTIEELENWAPVEDGWKHSYSGIPELRPEGCDSFEQRYISGYQN